MKKTFEIGDRIIYRGTKITSRIGQIGTVVGPHNSPYLEAYYVDFGNGYPVSVYAKNMRVPISTRLMSGGDCERFT